MSFSWKKSIGTRFTIVTVLLVSLITMLFFGFDAAVSYRKELARLNQELVQIQYSHLPSLISSLWQTDYPLLQQQITSKWRMMKGTPSMPAGEIYRACS